MVLNLGGFKFNWKQTDNVAIDTEFGISTQERIQNHPALFAANLGKSSIKIEGHTLPFNGDKQTALKLLYALAGAGLSYPLITGTGRILGRFVISKISEKRAIFANDGRFFTQSFSLELIRDYE